VPRDRLVAAITAAADAKLTLVLAPAGSGKTTLLGEWRSSPLERRQFAWMSLDAGDNDPVKLFEGLIAALRTVEPGLGTEALAALAGPGELTENVLPSLINELAELPAPLVLVLDDYHVIRNARIHEAVAFLLERLPRTVQVALASRSEPPLPVGRLRVRRELVEIHAADLRFTDEEAGALLSGALGFSLDPDDVARLQERTEGWAAGLQLAALSIGGRDDAHDFISSFAGDDRPVVDYLGFEVLDGQPPEVREFLLRTSVLDRMSGPLCDAVAQVESSTARLDELERAGLFLLPLDTKRRWYRCHHLFRELLRHELERTDPDSVEALHRRAAAWYRERGSASEAIQHAIAGGDAAGASELITEHWYGFLQRGRIETVAGWLEALGDEAVSADAALCLTRAWIAVNTGDLAEVGRWIRAAEQAAEGGADAVVSAGIASLHEIHRYMGGDVGRAVEAGRRSVERGDTPWRPVGCPVLGIALFWSGRAGEAAEELSEAVRVARAGGNHLAVIHASGGLAAIQAEQGELDPAERVAAEALELADERGLSGHWATTMAHVVQGRALEQRGRLAEADAQIEQGAELSRSGVAAVEIAYALLSRAEARQLQGDPDGAAELATEARRVVERCPDPGILQDMLARTERRLHLSSHVRAASHPHADELTERELAVLQLLPSELSKRDIGAALYLSLNTIKTHTRAIYRKLGVETRDEAVARARELDLI
jgi:LuxR family transcriptional regulator, maltose regulon positive regulatory protein